jgi:hypothetical protein
MNGVSFEYITEYLNTLIEEDDKDIVQMENMQWKIMFRLYKRKLQI